MLADVDSQLIMPSMVPCGAPRSASLGAGLLALECAVVCELLRMAGPLIQDGPCRFYEMFEMDAFVGVECLGLQFMKGDQPHAGFPEAVSYTHLTLPTKA